jgi:hypothetical protein
MAGRLQLLPSLGLVMLFGCTLHHTPKSFELDEPWPSLTASEPVAVRLGDAPSGKRTIKLAGQSMTLDLREYTRALVERVEAALTAQGVAVASGATKNIELEVTHANILPGAGNNHCVVDFTVRTSGGYVKGLQARAESMDPQKACNAALSRAALTCVSDAQFRAYLASGGS